MKLTIEPDRIYDILTDERLSADEVYDGDMRDESWKGVVREEASFYNRAPLIHPLAEVRLDIYRDVGKNTFSAKYMVDWQNPKRLKLEDRDKIIKSAGEILRSFKDWTPAGNFDDCGFFGLNGRIVTVNSTEHPEYRRSITFGSSEEIMHPFGDQESFGEDVLYLHRATINYINAIMNSAVGLGMIKENPQAPHIEL